MALSRRDFLKYCGMSAVALGLSTTDLLTLEEALANPGGPSVLWLHGSGCSGCSISFLNRVSGTAPTTVADLLVNSINLVYHPTISAVGGEDAVALINQTYNNGKYILIVEGGVPTAFGGNACIAWSSGGRDVTFQQAVTKLASKASHILSIGTCAAWGGVSASGSNIAGVRSVKSFAGKKTVINIPGCPPHPDWIVWTVSQILLKKKIKLDKSGRPVTLFSKTVHSLCPRRDSDEASTFGIPGRCLEELGCRGPETHANCPTIKWNGGVSWCIGTNSPCIGCTEPTFPGTASFYSEGEGDEDD